MNDLLYNKLGLYGDIETNVSFKKLTTFRVGGTAKYVIYPKNMFSLKAIINICLDENIDYKVLGNGSNILPSDDEYEGLIIKLSRYLIDYYFEDTSVTVQAGCSLIALSYKAADMSLSGLEFASGIPATVGGAIYMNAGAYKSDMSELIEQVTVLRDNEITVMSNEECQFSYRHSIFQNHPDWIILECRLNLHKDDLQHIKEVMANRREKRFATQPLDYPSAGSTFRNCADRFAWQYVDDIGYRGKQVGGAMVSPKHSNFIINYDNASAGDILELSNQIISKVKDQFGVEMIMEVEKFNWKK